MGKNVWTYEKCYEEAKRFRTKTDFKEGNPCAYNAACRHKWVKDFQWFEELVKPCGYWTYQRCYEEAKKFTCRAEFQRGRRGAYKAALREGWLNDYDWLKTPPSRNRKWCYETCLEESKKYTSFSEFRKNKVKAYLLAKEMGWLDEYTWLKCTRKPNGYWDYEHCYDEAMKYKSRREFEEKNGSCYFAACKNGWLDDYYWIPKRKKVESKWTKEICFEIGRRYKTKVEFERNEKGCYIAAMRAGWLKEMDWFVPAVIEPMDMFKKSHCVYVYKDESSKIAYVGLTSNLKVRHNRHRLSGSVHDYFSSLNMEIPQPIVLVDELTPEESRYYEDFYVKKYRENGYTMLNKGTTGRYSGSFGGGRVKYTYEKCYEIAKTVKTKTEFYKVNPSCFNRAKLMDWLKDYTWFAK